MSRTVGIFGLPPDDWFEPLGVVSLLAEGAFVVLAAKVLSGERFAGRNELGDGGSASRTR